MPDAFTQKSFDLLKQLAANNNRAWFNAHKEQIEDCLQLPFAELLDAASRKLARKKIGLSGGPETMFRMNRDVRFSADKSPYKAQVSGMLTPSGAKDPHGGVLYAQATADGGMIACGHYQLSAADLGPIRDRIVKEPAAFGKVLKSLEKGGLSLSEEDALKTMPRGFQEQADHPLAKYLKLKSLIVSEDVPKSAWLDGGVVDRMVKIGVACAPLLAFRLEA